MDHIILGYILYFTRPFQNLDGNHRHLSNIDCLMARTPPGLFASLALLMGAAKKEAY
jgi:hypothetical protein